MQMSGLRNGFVFILLIAAGTAGAEPAAVVSAAWGRFIPGGGPMAGYLELRNMGDAPLTLAGAASAAFGAVSLHETVERNGRMTMRSRDGGVSVAPGATLALAPGGLHLMLMQRQQPLQVGDTVALELQFADHAPMTVALPLKPPSYQP